MQGLEANVIDMAKFVGGTLAYLSNCVVALLTLVGWSLRLRPIQGAMRCKVRSDFAPSETPDSRVMLFIASCIFGAVLTYGLRGFTETISALARAAIGASSLSKVAIITSILLYFTCELGIVRVTKRRVAPGRRGKRNRQVLRFLYVSLLIQVAVYEPIAFTLLGMFPDISWFKLTGNPLSLAGTFFDDGLMILRLIPVLLPFLYFYAILEKAKRSLRIEEAGRKLANLPLDLIGAALAGSLLTAFLYPEATPQLVTLHCRAVMGKEKDEVQVDALFRNEGESYWKLKAPLKLNLLGAPSYDWVTGDQTNFKNYSEFWAPIRRGEGPEELLVGPHRQVRFVRHLTFSKGYIGPGEDTGCSLTNLRPRAGILDAFSKHIPDEDLEWQKITPANFQVGAIDFDMDNATQDDINAAASDAEAQSDAGPRPTVTAPAKVGRQ